MALWPYPRGPILVGLTVGDATTGVPVPDTVPPKSPAVPGKTKRAIVSGKHASQASARHAAWEEEGEKNATDMSPERKKAFLEAMAHAAQEDKKATAVCRNGAHPLLSRPIIVEEDYIECRAHAIDGIRWTKIPFVEMEKIAES